MATVYKQLVEQIVGQLYVYLDINTLPLNDCSTANSFGFDSQSCGVAGNFNSFRRCCVMLQYGVTTPSCVVRKYGISDSGRYGTIRTALGVP